MCCYSFIADHYGDKWQKYVDDWNRKNKQWDFSPFTPYAPVNPPGLTPQEVNDVRELLRKAKEYDEKHNQPDCELEDKKKLLIELAGKLGIKLEL